MIGNTREKRLEGEIGLQAQLSTNTIVFGKRGVPPYGSYRNKPSGKQTVRFPPGREVQALLACQRFVKADWQLSDGETDGQKTPNPPHKIDRLLFTEGQNVCTRQVAHQNTQRMRKNDDAFLIETPVALPQEIGPRSRRVSLEGPLMARKGRALGTL